MSPKWQLEVRWYETSTDVYLSGCDSVIAWVWQARKQFTTFYFFIRAFICVTLTRCHRYRQQRACLG